MDHQNHFEINSKKLLSVKDLSVGFHTESGFIQAVDRVSFDLFKGKTLGLVGESGCGKSVTARSLMRLLEYPHGQISEGEILFNGQNIVTLSEQEMHRMRGLDIAMIFQEPMLALNPVLPIYKQLSENLILKQSWEKKDLDRKMIELMEWVGIPSAKKRLEEYPHQLSGGMRQRVMIAMALSCEPQLLIADEPTTALDVTVQLQILDLLARIQKEAGMSILFITHDLGVVSEMCNDLAVMYAGRIVEYGRAQDIFQNPLHPYSQSLLRCLPQDGLLAKCELDTIKGFVPPIKSYSVGCRFASRCGAVHEGFNHEQKPAMKEFNPNHWVENCGCVQKTTANL
jgi:peptide/nickel transport system ATP-binding protein